MGRRQHRPAVRSRLQVDAEVVATIAVPPQPEGAIDDPGFEARALQLSRPHAVPGCEFDHDAGGGAVGHFTDEAGAIGTCWAFRPCRVRVADYQIGLEPAAGVGRRLHDIEFAGPARARRPDQRDRSLGEWFAVGVDDHAETRMAQLGLQRRSRAERDDEEEQRLGEGTLHCSDDSVPASGERILAAFGLLGCREEQARKS